MKIYTIKYALTTGIEEHDAKASVTNGLMVVESERFSQYFHGENREWFTDLEKAKSACEVKRQKKIASLEKSIAKLKAIKF